MPSTMKIDGQAKEESVFHISDDAEDIIDDEDPEDIEMKSTNLGQNSRRAFLKELRKVVDHSDVILHVLDARDPLGTKSSAIEEMVLSNHKKRLVYVLNKADLVPRDVLAAWLIHLRRLHPTIPFKCNTQNQKGNLGIAMGKVSKQQESALQTNQAVGAEELLGLLKNYSRVGDVKSTISVGIVGFPNVGKSSLINSLLRSRAVGVSAMPGFTKVTQEVILDKNIRLIDSPGIVFADGDSASTSLRNCVNIEELDDVLTPLQAILERCPQGYLMQLYGIPKFKDQDCIAFLALVAKVTGKLKKGGIPNTDAAARTVLHDWNSGRIKYYCKPPILSSTSLGDEKVILGEYSEEMDVLGLRDEDMRVLSQLEAASAADDSSAAIFVGMENVAPTTLDMDLDSGHADNSNVGFSNPKSRGGVQAKMDAVDDDEDDADAIEVASSTSEGLTGSGRGSARPRSSQKTGGSAASLDSRVVGVLSRSEHSRYATEGAVEPIVDPRKQQKKGKKKVLKDSRRNSGGSMMQEDYNFEEDFTY